MDAWVAIQVSYIKQWGHCNQMHLEQLDVTLLVGSLAPIGS